MDGQQHRKPSLCRLRFKGDDVGRFRMRDEYIKGFVNCFVGLPDRQKEAGMAKDYMVMLDDLKRNDLDGAMAVYRQAVKQRVSARRLRDVATSLLRMQDSADAFLERLRSEEEKED
jgi:hypothetical protein